MLKRIWQGLKRFFTLIERFERIRVEPEVIEDICFLARGAAPKEMVAFLTGKVHEEGVRTLVIDGLYVKSYHANTHSTTFTTHDLPLIGVHGTVHSHPGTSNRPSEADLTLFNKYGSVNMIIARPYTPSTIACYDKYGNPISVAFASGSTASSPRAAAAGRAHRGT